MSTWADSHSPPPRGERDRSPSRGVYGRSALPDQSYPPDQSRDWDTYGRDRNWAEWDRERLSYEARRGRSRSPTYDDGRKRRRSLSPYDRERYDPRPRYDDYDAHRNHGRSPPRNRGKYGYGSTGRSGHPPPVDPHTLNYPASLKQYADWFRYTFPDQAKKEDKEDKASEVDGVKSRNGIKSRWEKYKKDFLAQQLQTLFDHHKKSPWFAEKYDPTPDLVKLRNRVRKVGWRGRMNQFLNELEEGKFDAGSNESEPEPSSPVKEDAMISGSSGLGDEGSAKQDDSAKNDDEFGMGPENEEAADNAGDLKLDTNSKASYDAKTPAKDEISVSPEGTQIMIRTIPPDIGRVKLEEEIKEFPGLVYLALGDPMQKRNYYRAGWIKFNEDVDVSKLLSTLGEKKVEGFKLHVSHNSRPFSSKIRYAPEIASSPSRIAKDLEQAKRLASILEIEYERIRLYKPEPSLTNGNSNKEQNGETSTDGNEHPIEDVLMRDALADEEEPREAGSEAVERRIAKLVTELPEASSEVEASALEEKKKTIALDLYLAYLRNAFHTCYYCVSTSDHIEELQRKCIKHVRKSLTKSIAAETAQQADANNKVDAENVDDGAQEPEEKGSREKKDWKRNDERWVEWLDNRIALLINKDNIDARDYGGKRYDDELSKAVEPHVKQEDEGKFRCKSCSKLFKATEFVEKHIANKHADILKGLDDIPYYNNFALDPQRIQPFTHYPQPTGNSQAPPPQAYGLQSAQPAWDMGRGGAPPPMPYYGYPPPIPHFNGHPDAYPYPGYFNPYSVPPPMGPPPTRSLRDEPPLSAGGRRLGDRIGGYAPGQAPDLSGHGIEGLPPKPMAALEPGPGGRRNGRGPPPPPPPNAKEDPRAAAGRKVSYHDMDLVAEGDVELNY